MSGFSNTSHRFCSAGLFDAVRWTSPSPPPISLFLAQDGIDHRIIYVVDHSLGGDALVARPGISSLDELAGRAVGIELSRPGMYVFGLDDFGTGISSFAYIKNLPVDFLKIDGVFVKEMMDDSIDHVVAQPIQNIGHEMGKTTVAEFVENEAIRGSLSRIGVDLCQGFGIARPGPLSELLDGQ